MVRAPGTGARGLGTGQGTGAGSIGHGDLDPGTGRGTGTQGQGPWPGDWGPRQMHGAGTGAESDGIIFGHGRWAGSVHLTGSWPTGPRSEEHTSELQSRENRVCRLLLEKNSLDNRAAVS